MIEAEIDLPISRLPRNIEAVRYYSGKEEELPKPIVNVNQITWKRAYKFRGFPYGEYEISWRW